MEWSDTWLLKFHPEKCKQMTIGNTANTDNRVYSLCGTELQKVTQEKDIGVTVDFKLTFERHIAEKVKKANQMFSMIRRTFQNLNEKNFIPLYKALVRSHLDFSCAVWSPANMKTIELVEGVQRRATKQIPGFRNLSYPDRLKRLKLPTLSYRRVRNDMIEVYKIVNGIYDNKCISCLNMWQNVSHHTETRGHHLKIYPQQSRLKLRQNSFAVRVTNLWNSLPLNVILSPTINTFKARIDAFWSNQEILYDFKQKIKTTGRNT